MDTVAASGQHFSINGIDLYFERHGQGEPLLLLHGFTGYGGDWAPMFGDFGRDHGLIVPDLRGHGRSTNPSDRFLFGKVARDLLALLDHLGIERVKAVGLSAGAKTLLHMATLQPDRIDAMVLVSATPYFPLQARAIMAMVSADTQPDAEWQIMRQRHAYGDDQIRALWRQANAFKDNYEDMSFTPPRLATITARTLIVHGDRDPFYPCHLALELRAAIPRSWLWIVPNGGHGPIFGDLNGPFVQTALEFLRGAWEG